MVPWQVIRSATARRDIRQFIRYLQREAGAAAALTYAGRLEHDIQVLIASSPETFAWFHETGEPYRAKLFKLTRTTWWIVYVVDPGRRRVEIVRLWNTAREPDSHGL